MADQETTTEVKETRQSVIAAALDKVEQEVDKTSDEKQNDTKYAAEVDKKADTSKDEEAKLIEDGKQLIMGLRDPEKAPIIIDFLARQMGYSKAEIKAAVADQSGVKGEELVSDLVKDLEESLGEEFNFLAPKIGKGLEKAIDKIINKTVEKNTADIRKDIEAREVEKLESQSLSALNKLSADFFGPDESIPDDVHSEMSKYMDRVKPDSNTSVKEYIEDAFHYAVGKKGLVRVDPKKSSKIERNRNDAAGRLASSRVPAESNIREVNSKPMSRQEAIQKALESFKGE